jgi:hypothetical protein
VEGHGQNVIASTAKNLISFQNLFNGTYSKRSSMCGKKIEGLAAPNRKQKQALSFWPYSPTFYKSLRLLSFGAEET